MGEGTSSPGDSIEECPRVRAVEAPDDHGLQQRWIEVAQVHAVPGTRLGIQWFPVGDDAARLATHVLQCPVAPDIAFRVAGMAFHSVCAQRVVGPDASGPAAERAVATGGFAWREWKREADRPAVTGAVE